MWRITFTHAGALWLATAASLPLIIHLLSRQKPRLIRFPAVQFIRLSQRRSFYRTRFRHLLLLLLRMALLVLFAAVIARPILRAGGAAGAEGAPEGAPAVALVLDDSLSMSYRVGDATWFDTARSRAVELARRLPERVTAAVLTTSHPSGKLLREPQMVAGRITAAQPGTRANSCWRALESAAEILRGEAASRRDIFLFTDMTQSAWAGHEQRMLDLGPDVHLHIVDCADREGTNGAVTELRQQGEPAILGAVLALEARLAGWGAPLTRAVQFEFDGAAVERRELSVEPGEEAVLTFHTLLSQSGHHWGRVALLSPDGLPQDDARTFTVEVAPEVSLLCVEDDPGAALPSASYFLRLALNPWEEAGRGMFRIQRASPAQLEQMPLAPFDVVALVQAGGVTETGWRRLDAYASGGGGVLAFLGPQTEDAYRTAAARAVLPAEVGPVVAAPPEGPFGLRIAKTAHPFVIALAESGATLAQVRYRQCRLLSPAPDAVEVLSFGPGLPALVISEVGGKVALFAGTADDRWGEFARTEPFAPFCHELLLYLAGRSGAGMASLSTGAQVPLTFEASRWPTTVYVTAPGAQTPERLLPGTTPGKVTYWRTDAPGYYRVDFERHDRKWRSGFAVNTAPIESRLDKVPFEKVKASIRAGTVELAADAPVATAAGQMASGATELAPYLALLGLGLLLAECFLANRFYGAQQPPPPRGETGTERRPAEPPAP